jgi:hypothetical protein
MQVPPRFHRAAIRIEKLAAAHVVAESDAITPGQSSRRAEKTRERFRAATNALELQQKIFTSRTEASGRRQAKTDPTRELLRMGRRMTRAIEELVRVECRRVSFPAPSPPLVRLLTPGVRSPTCPRRLWSLRESPKKVRRLRTARTEMGIRDGGESSVLNNKMALLYASSGEAALTFLHLIA